MYMALWMKKKESLINFFQNYIYIKNKLKSTFTLIFLSGKFVKRKCLMIFNFIL